MSKENYMLEAAAAAAVKANDPQMLMSSLQELSNSAASGKSAFTLPLLRLLDAIASHNARSSIDFPLAMAVAIDVGSRADFDSETRLHAAKAILKLVDGVARTDAPYAIHAVQRAGHMARRDNAIRIEAARSMLKLVGHPDFVDDNFAKLAIDVAQDFAKGDANLYAKLAAARSYISTSSFSHSAKRDALQDLGYIDRVIELNRRDASAVAQRVNGLERLLDDSSISGFRRAKIATRRLVETSPVAAVIRHTRNLVRALDI